MKCIKNLFLVSALLLLSSVVRAGSDPLPYPGEYRSWEHIKTMLIQPGHALENPFQGIHHIYANKAARQGLANGNYPDGAILVFDLLEYTEQEHTIQEGARKLIGVMQRDSARYAATGGWGFEAFAGDSRSKRLVDDGGTSCYACHTAQRDQGFVFTRLRP